MTVASADATGVDGGRLDASLLARVSTGAVAALLSIALTVVGVLLWASSVPSIHPYRAGDEGLLPQLTVMWWAGLVCVVLAIVVAMVRARPYAPVVCVGIAGLVLILHGTLPASESTPRFDAAYAIAGFTDYVAKTGSTLPLLDARMSWPSLFAGAGLLTRAAGVSPDSLLRWCPLALNVAYLFPVKVLANTGLRSARARWLALVVFVPANWIDQDYFSPQGVDLLLYLVVLAVAVRALGAVGARSMVLSLASRARDRLRPVGGAPRRERTSTSRTSTEDFPAELPTGQKVAFCLVIAGIAAAAITSSPITPIALTLSLAAVTLVARTRLRWMWLLVGLGAAAWISWEAHTYWAGNLNEILGGVGAVGATVHLAVGVRLHGASPGRQLVQHARVAAAVVTVGGSAAGFLWMLRRARTSMTMVALAVAPVFLVVAVTYGGEVTLRVLLFALAPASVLIASLVEWGRRLGVVLFAICLSGLLVLFPLTRYGNESFEAISPGDVAAAQWMQTHIPTNAVVFVANRDEPLELPGPRLAHVRVSGVSYLRSPKQIRASLPTYYKSVWFLLTRSESKYGSVYLGLPTDWQAKVKANLLATGEVVVAYQDSTATVLELKPSPARAGAK